MNLLVASMDLEVFFNEKWWVVLLKALFAFVILLVLTLFTIWYERRVVAFMQHRQGPHMNGPFGLLQSLADGMKLMFKEDITPTAADKIVFMLAPFVVAVPAILKNEVAIVAQLQDVVIIARTDRQIVMRRPCSNDVIERIDGHGGEAVAVTRRSGFPAP